MKIQYSDGEGNSYPHLEALESIPQEREQYIYYVTVSVQHEKQQRHINTDIAIATINCAIVVGLLLLHFRSGPSLMK